MKTVEYKGHRYSVGEYHAKQPGYATSVVIEQGGRNRDGSLKQARVIKLKDGDAVLVLRPKKEGEE